MRDFRVPLDVAQPRNFRYDYLSPTHLISRLTSRNLHLLALHISSFLSLPPDNVLKHWASAKITKSKSIPSGSGKEAEMVGDEEVSRAIVEKFEKLGGASVSYAEIAKKAWEVGRTRLATMVSDAISLNLSLDATQKDVVVGPRAEGIRSSTLVAVDERRPAGAPESCR